MNGGALDGCSIGRIMFNTVLIAGSDYYYTQQRFRNGGIATKDKALANLFELARLLALEWSSFEPGESRSAAEAYIAFISEGRDGELALLEREVDTGNVSILDFTDIRHVRYRLASPVVAEEFMREACREHDDYIAAFRKELASRYEMSFPPSDAPDRSDTALLSFKN